MGTHREHGGLNRVDEKAMQCDSREQQENVSIGMKLTHEERSERGRAAAGDQRPSRAKPGDGPRAEQGAENPAGVVERKGKRGIDRLQARRNEQRREPAEGGVDSEQAKQKCAPKSEGVAKVIRAEQVGEASLHLGLGAIEKS